MAQLLDLPSEILSDIIQHVLLNNQPSHPFASTCTDSEIITSEVIRANSHKKILTGSIIQGLEETHTFQSDLCYHRHKWHKASYLSRIQKRDLRALSRVCQRMKKAVDPWFWQLVELRHNDSERPSPTWKTLLHVFLMKSEIAALVKGLSLKPDEAPAIRRETLNDLPFFFYLLPNLRVLDIYSKKRAVRSLGEFLENRLQSNTPLPPGLQNLTELSFRSSLPEYADWYEFHALHPLFTLPSLYILYFSSIGVQLSPLLNHQEEEEARRLFPLHVGKSRVKVLIFRECVIAPSVLLFFLQLPSALECFSWTFSSQARRPFKILHHILQGLVVQARSLRALEIRGPPASRRDDHRCEIGTGLVRDFTGLKELGCPVVWLLFGGREPRTRRVAPRELHARTAMRCDQPIYTLAETIPYTVVKLRLYVYDEWYLDYWAAEVKDLLFKKSEVVPELKYLSVVYWSLTGKIWFEGPREAEDKMRVARTIEGLVAFGKEVGVEVSVVVNETAESVEGAEIAEEDAT